MQTRAVGLPGHGHERIAQVIYRLQSARASSIGVVVFIQSRRSRRRDFQCVMLSLAMPLVRAAAACGPVAMGLAFPSPAGPAGRPLRRGGIGVGQLASVRGCASKVRAICACEPPRLFGIVTRSWLLATGRFNVCAQAEQLGVSWPLILKPQHNHEHDVQRSDSRNGLCLCKNMMPR